MQTLPEHIISHIGSFLDYNSRYACIESHKNMFRTINHIFKRIEITITNPCIVDGADLHDYIRNALKYRMFTTPMADFIGIMFKDLNMDINISSTFDAIPYNVKEIHVCIKSKNTDTVLKLLHYFKNTRLSRLKLFLTDMSADIKEIDAELAQRLLCNRHNVEHLSIMCDQSYNGLLQFLGKENVDELEYCVCDIPKALCFNICKQLTGMVFIFPDTNVSLEFLQSFKTHFIPSVIQNLTFIFMHIKNNTQIPFYKYIFETILQANILNKISISFKFDYRMCVTTIISLLQLFLKRLGEKLILLHYNKHGYIKCRIIKDFFQNNDVELTSSADYCVDVDSNPNDLYSQLLLSV